MIPWQDIPGFKDHLRDFLVQIREFTGEDDTDLYLEEREVSGGGGSHACKGILIVNILFPRNLTILFILPYYFLLLSNVD